MFRVVVLCALLSVVAAQTAQCTKLKLTFNSRRLPSKPKHWTDPYVFVKDLTGAPQPRGYCTKQVQTLGSFTNKAMCAGPKSNIAYEIDISVYEPTGAVWDLRWGPDVTTGFVVLHNKKIWSTELIQNNYGLWWAGKWSHPHVRDIKPEKFNAGWNTVTIVGGERCCDGKQALQFKRGGGAWQDLSMDNLKKVCQIPPVCTKCAGCTDIKACNNLGTCMWKGSCVAKCAKCDSTCTTQAGCTNNPYCNWLNNGCHPKCTTCGGCRTQASCENLNQCQWTKKGKCKSQCFTSCSCANNPRHCTKMNACQWLAIPAPAKCSPTCLQCSCNPTKAKCDLFGAQCQWNGKSCVDPCSGFPPKCSCFKTAGLCSTKGGLACAWTTNTPGGTATCMPKVNACSAAKTQSMCNYVSSLGCKWDGSTCAVPAKKCEKCSDCTSPSTCADDNGKTNAPCTWLKGKCQEMPVYYCQCQPTPRASPQNMGRWGYYCDTKESPHVRSFISHNGWAPRAEFGVKKWTTKKMMQKGKSVEAIVTLDDEWICCPGQTPCDKP